MHGVLLAVQHAHHPHGQIQATGLSDMRCETSTVLVRRKTIMMFDGETYDEALDEDRLKTQLARVRALMWDQRWRTLDDISRATGDPHASVSARLRDLRKGKFGAHIVERERVKRGLYRYRLLPGDNQ
jgi:hypothetical protein